MRTPLRLAVVATAMAMAVGAAAIVGGSSHREAPLISQDPAVDATDLYAFVDPNDPSKVNLIANYYPAQDPAGGPNFYRFADEALYLIHVDNDGDTKADFTFEFQFSTDVQNPNTFLYNTGPITSLDDPDWNIRQHYKVVQFSHESGGTQIQNLGLDLMTPPVNIGPNSIPDYQSLADAAVHDLGDGMKVFAGQRDDPFFVDLGSLFDLLTIRELPGNSGGGVDALAGLNVLTIALQVPADLLTSSDDVIGVWTTSRRPQQRVLQHDGSEPEQSGEGVQVSRLGMPLVNEVIIPLGQKDEFNASYPKDDAQFLSFVTSPEPAALLNLLYGNVLEEVPETDRQDLVTVFLTGIDGLNQPQNVTPSEMMRLNTAIGPSDDPNPLGVLAGDNSGFPNGRRPADDVVDAELRAVACGYTLGPCTGLSPNDQLGDGVDQNDVDFLDAFPYLAPPHSGFDHEHHGPSPMALTAASIGGSLLLGGLALGGLAIRGKRRETAE